jgi:hypothetical protein
MVDSRENAGEALFKRYLYRWGYDDFKYHTDWLNPPKKPDFLINTPYGEVVVEVESFTTWGLFENAKPGMALSRSLKQGLAPVRRAISHAAEQLKGIEGRPLIVVLANPLNRPIPLEQPMIVSAMYGDLEYAFPAESDEPGYWRPGRNGRLHLVDDRGVARGNHDYVSAVAVVREGLNQKAWAEAWWRDHESSYESPLAAIPDFEAACADAPEATVTLDVFETLSEHCVPLPAEVFLHDGDTRWGAIAPGQYGRRV